MRQTPSTDRYCLTATPVGVLPGLPELMSVRIITSFDRLTCSCRLAIKNIGTAGAQYVTPDQLAEWRTYTGTPIVAVAM